MIVRSALTILAGAAAGAILGRLQPKPAPTVTRTITTYTEHDAANIHATPAPVEPAHWMNVMTRNNTGIYTAYRRNGFDDDQAYGLLCLHIEGSYLQGRRG